MKQSRPKAIIAHAAVHPTKGILPHFVYATAKEVREDVSDYEVPGDWKASKALGWRVIKVRIVPVLAPLPPAGEAAS